MMKERYIAIILCISILFLCGCGAVVKECQLSLCDCKCHPAGQTPEALGGGKMCGINCMGIYNITGCELVGERCVEIYNNKSLDTGSCGTSSCKA